METHPHRPHPTLKPGLLAAATLALLTTAAPIAWATGGFEEEPLPPLSDYLRLDQLPAKSIGDIHAETGEAEPKPVKINYQAELLALPKKSGAEALTSLDKMTAAARTAALNPLLNLLNDVRDLYAGPGNATESAAYLEWRMEHADQFGITFAPPKEGAPAEEEKEKALNKELLTEIERQAAKASPALKPHWLYLRAATEYRAGEVAESQALFLKVAHDFPNHPRAEAGLFMALRCAIWKSRKAEYTQTDRQLNEGERAKAKKLFDEYFTKFPHGRFQGDALGWAGALAFDGGDYAGALRCYADQLALPGHPEQIPGAVDMVEKTLSWLSSKPQDPALAEVAKHPEAAQALTYLLLNTSETDNYNGKYETVEEVRGWRKKILPRLAAAITAEQKRYASATWKPRYLAMLALAASNSGQHEQAVKLIDGAGSDVAKSDDLLFARAVALHRAKKSAEAATTLQQLLAHFPQSPLARGARLRLGLALTDDHRAGEAVLALQPLVPKEAAAGQPPALGEAADAESDDNEPDPDGSSPILYGIDVRQIRGLIDTLLNFAPIGELAAPAAEPKLDPVDRLRFHEAIAERLLAKEQFDEAKPFMAPAQWELLAGPLARLTKAAQDAKEPAAHAAACRKLGDAWAALRGKLLTFPLDTDKTRTEVYPASSSDANARRLAAAPFIGAGGKLAIDLEDRDELRHAFKWWLEASDAQPGTPPTAQALWLALRAMPLIADVSPFTFDRAVERKWTDTARKLYDRLRTECPASEEAQRKAVAWDFTAPKKPAKGEADDTESGGVRFPAGEDLPGTIALNLPEDDGGGNDDKNAGKLLEQIEALAKQAGGADPAKLLPKIEALRAPARKEFTSFNDLRWVNLLDDLALFFAEPDPGAKTRALYADLRFRFVHRSAIGGGDNEEDAKVNPDTELADALKAALADPAVKPVADYFEFLQLAIVANHFVFVKVGSQNKTEGKDDDADTYRTHDYPKLAKLSAAFLEKYPQSKKREAALLLHARAVFQASKEVVMKKPVTWPQGARWEGGYEISVTSQEPFDAKRVTAALDAYDHAFPEGRYAADIRDLRGALALRQHDWKTALDLTIAPFDAKDSGALLTSAANRLADLFACLADERYRADLLPAIKASPRARALLTTYLANNSDAHPLRYMKGWLREQLAAK